MVPKLDTFVYRIVYHERCGRATIQTRCEREEEDIEQNRTEQNIRLFRHSAYIAHSPYTKPAWNRKEKRRKKTSIKKLVNIKYILINIHTCENVNFNEKNTFNFKQTYVIKHYYQGHKHYEFLNRISMAIPALLEEERYLREEHTFG